MSELIRMWLSSENDIIEMFRPNFHIINEYPSGTFEVLFNGRVISVSPSDAFQPAEYCVLQCCGSQDNMHFSDPRPCASYEEAEKLIRESRWCELCE